MTLTISEDIDNKVNTRKKRNEELRIERLLASDKSKGYTDIRRDMIVSHAFLSLSKNSIILLMMFLMKRRLKYRKGKSPICKNTNDIRLTWKEFTGAPLRLSRGAFGRSKKQLIKHGFIKIVHQGGGCKKDVSLYGISEKWRLWKDGIDFSPKKSGTKYGYQGKFNSNLIQFKRGASGPIHRR